MSLQARLRHTLGERWIELPERGVDQPLVVGRAGTADVQVPSVTVAQKHCVLFVHEGRWVVQDVGAGATGIYVNGSKVEGAAFLHVGDLITLGTDGAAPSVEIDPGGVAEGRTGQPAAATAPPGQGRAAAPDPSAAVSYPAPSQAAAPHIAAHLAASAAYPPAYPVHPGAYPVPAAAAPAHWAQPAPAAQVADGSIPDWPADATPRYYTPRRRRTSDGSNGVIIGMFLTLLITAGAGYWLYRHFEKPAPVVVQAPPASTQSPPAVVPSPTPDDKRSAPPTIFTPPAAPQTAPRPTRPPFATESQSPPLPGLPDRPDPAAAAPGVETQPLAGTDPHHLGSTDATSSQDPADPATMTSDDPAWKQVEAAVHLKDEAKAILRFDDYARTHPGAATETLQAHTETMLDRIWFERIENLCEQREDLNRKIREVDNDLAQETNAAYKKRVLIPLRRQYASRLENIEEELTKNMKYDGQSIPNLLDHAEIDKLRQSRDPIYYASWKKRVLAHIRRTHGELPWVATKSR